MVQPDVAKASDVVGSQAAVAAERLSRDYESSATAFTERYRDKVLLVVGTVEGARLFGDREIELTFASDGARVVGWFSREEFGKRRGIYLGEELWIKCPKFSDLIGTDAPQITLLDCKVSK